jgi:HEAT repeat protein
MKMIIQKRVSAKGAIQKSDISRTLPPGIFVQALMLVLLVAGGASLGSAQAQPVAPPRSERLLIDVLKSNATLQEKDAACAELKRAGTALAVPALADLLADKDLSHAARYALESMPAPEAGLALVASLDRTGGLIRSGIIQSLGQRREIRAAPALIKLLDDPDPHVANASAAALGAIGGDPAIQSLFVALAAGREPGRKSAILDALLAAANREQADGRRDAASAVFDRIGKLPVPEHVRTAAYRGLIASAGQARALELVRSAILGEGGPEQLAALETARTLDTPGMTRLLRDSLGKAAPPLQVALIEALRQRGDPAAAPTILALVKSRESDVRVAALGAAGALGDATAVPDLLEGAGSADDAVTRAARQALLVLKRGDVTRALADQLAGGRPAIQVEAARALSGRGDRAAVEKLIAAARQNADPVRGAAFLALGQLAEPKDLPQLVNLVIDARDDAAREQARDALGSACLRLKARGIGLDAGPIVGGLASADPLTRAALLQAGSGLADDRLRSALRRAVGDPDPGVREAAARALWETRDPGLLPDLLAMARQPGDLTRRVQAVRGYVRLATDTENVDLTPAVRVKSVSEILPLARAEEKWAALAGLAKIVDLASLELALTMLDDAATRAEAAQAVTAIASGLFPAHPEHARLALEKVLAAGSDSDQGRAALTVLRQIDPAAGTGSAVNFRRLKVDGAFRSEGVAVADFDRDGRLDIATGNILYAGPEWRPRPMLGEAKAYDPEAYSNEFLCFPEDIDRDGWTDLIVVGFPEAKTRWLRNPGRRVGPWKEFLAVEKTGNESPDWVDVDKDGHKELVFASENGMAFARPAGDPGKPWPIRVIAGPGDPRPAHGLGIGDINGDGRADVVCPEGWWEGPADPARLPWTFHAAKLGFEAPAQMIVLDVDGDGDADVISSGAHRYGLWWYEQTPEGWRPHEIDHRISQLHALHLADFNRDGLPDLVTGKRFWAHRHNDEGIDDPAVLCWFEMKRADGKPSWVRHDIDGDSGVGLHFQIVDLDGDGLLDIVTSNKKGVYVFMQEKTP